MGSWTVTILLSLLASVLGYVIFANTLRKRFRKAIGYYDIPPEKLAATKRIMYTTWGCMVLLVMSSIAIWMIGHDALLGVLSLVLLVLLAPFSVHIARSRKSRKLSER
jgi:hypothetical protein